MINKLRNKLLSSNLKHYKKIEIVYGELVISADDFTGYELIEETVAIDNMIDKKLYKVKHLNDNIMIVKQKRKIPS